MTVLSGVSDFFGLDIGSSALRAVQLRGTGAIKALDVYGQLPIEDGSTMSDAEVDQQKLAQIIKEFIHQIGISSKNVAVNLPSHRVFTTVIDMDRMSPSELAKAINYQAESFIPTPPSESKIDWAIIGDSPKDQTKIEVLLTSVPNDFIEKRLDMLESIGLNVIAFEPDSMAIVRSVVPVDVMAPQMIVDIGSKATDLVIAMNGAPHLSRAIATGSEAIIRSAVQNLHIDPKQAEQFVLKFGLGKDKLEGQVYNAIISTVEALMGEIDKSIKFFQGRYPNTKLERIIVTGGASTLPEFPLYVANRFGISVEIGNAWRNVSFPASKQNELLATSSHFAAAVGLAERQT
jgi:type IV pilus assembly protein PilM